MTTAKLAANAVTTAKLAAHLSQTQASALTPSGTTETVDFDNGEKQILDLSSASGNVTLTLSNPQTGGQYRIKVIQGGTARTLVWPAAVLWPQGEEPSQHHLVNTTNMVWL